MKYLLFAVIACTFLLEASAQKTVRPFITGYGDVFEVAAAKEVVNKKGKYKILIDIVTPAANAKEISEHFENIARIANLHVAAGVKPENLSVMAVVHGPAVSFILNNETYKQKYGIDNPNQPLFTALKAAGIPLYVCGQTLFKRKVDPATLAPEFDIVQSAVTTITTYAPQGYTVLKY
ncbi:MAG: hypothetical protein RI983_81 [Bacteroidota bacterium]|jgi:intracellular sulfur oxidation DsrE/DsrF family protein